MPPSAPSARLLPWLLAALAGCTLSTGGTSVSPVGDGGGVLDASPVDSGPAGDAPTDGPVVDAPMPGCPLSGKHALQLKANVGWDPKLAGDIFTVIEGSPGGNTLAMTVLVDLDRQGNVLEGSLKVCDAQVPSFESTIAGEKYGVVFAHELWERNGMPRFPARVDLQCPDVGCNVDIPEVIVTLGVQMPDPTAAWPSMRSQLSYPDQDQDTYGGITLQALGPDAGGNYAYPPTSYDVFFIPSRAQELMLGIRVRATLQGKLETCSTLTGSTTALSIDTHAATCKLADTGATCTGEQTDFLDGNLPQWDVISATFSSVLLGDTADCAAARAAF